MQKRGNSCLHLVCISFTSLFLLRSYTKRHEKAPLGKARKLDAEGANLKLVL